MTPNPSFLLNPLDNLWAVYMGIYMNNGMQWLVCPNFIVGSPAIINTPGINITNAGPEIMRQTVKIARVAKNVICQYGQVYRDHCGMGSKAETRHEFVITDSSSVAEFLMKDEPFFIVTPFDNSWVSTLMKTRMMPVLPTPTHSTIRPIRLVWNNFDNKETSDARELFKQLKREGKSAFAVMNKQDKWKPIDDFPQESEECIFVERHRAGSQKRQPQVIVPIIDLWREAKEIQQEYALTKTSYQLQSA